MKITRIRLLGLKCFLTPAFEWPRMVSPYGIPDTLMVHGTNGSGKTTLLEGIAAVWDYVGRAIDKKKDAPEKETALLKGKFPCIPLMKGVRFAGFSVDGLLPGLDRPVWFIVATKHDFEQFEVENFEELRRGHYVAVIRTKAAREIIKTDSPVGQSELLAQLARVRAEIAEGKEVDFPNIVLIPSEGRVLGPRPRSLKIATDLSVNQWLAHYGEASQPDVASLLYEIHQKNEADFEHIRGLINKFLLQKQVTRITQNNLVEVRRNDPEAQQPHTIHELASGEKQVVLMLAYISRWLRTGGILLMDEPDLHLHIRISSLLVRILRGLAKARGAQLIFSSHSPELWDDFPSERDRVSMDPYRENTQEEREAQEEDRPGLSITHDGEA